MHGKGKQISNRQSSDIKSTELGDNIRVIEGEITELDYVYTDSERKRLDKTDITITKKLRRYELRPDGSKLYSNKLGQHTYQEFTGELTMEIFNHMTDQITQNNQIIDQHKFANGRYVLEKDTGVIYSKGKYRQVEADIYEREYELISGKGSYEIEEKPQVKLEKPDHTIKKNQKLYQAIDEPLEHKSILDNKDHKINEYVNQVYVSDNYIKKSGTITNWCKENDECHLSISKKKFELRKVINKRKYQQQNFIDSAEETALIREMKEIKIQKRSGTNIKAGIFTDKVTDYDTDELTGKTTYSEPKKYLNTATSAGIKSLSTCLAVAALKGNATKSDYAFAGVSGVDNYATNYASTLKEAISKSDLPNIKALTLGTLAATAVVKTATNLTKRQLTKRRNKTTRDKIFGAVDTTIDIGLGVTQVATYGTKHMYKANGICSSISAAIDVTRVMTDPNSDRYDVGETVTNCGANFAIYNVGMPVAAAGAVKVVALVGLTGIAAGVGTAVIAGAVIAIPMVVSGKLVGKFFRYIRE